MDGHRRDDARAAQIGDIKCFDPPRIVFQLQRPLQPLQRLAAALLLRGAAQDLLARVERGALDEAQPLAAFGDLDHGFSPGALAQERLELLAVVALGRQQNAFRHCAARRIILPQQVGDRLAVLLERLVDHLRILAAHVAVLEVQHGEAAFRAAAEADGVGVRKRRRDDTLFMLQVFDGTDAVAQRSGRLEAQLLRRALHLFAQRGDELAALALEDQGGLRHAGAVVRPIASLEAPAGAAAHLVLQAWPFLSDVARELPRTVRQQQGVLDHADDLARLKAAAEGAVVIGAVLRRAARDRHDRIVAFRVDADEGVALVVLEQDIVVRLVALDQRVFQHQRLEFARGDDDVEIPHLVHHRGDLRQMLTAKIARDAVFQLLRLTDVKHLAVLVEHDIHARQQRQIIRFFQQRVKHVPFPCPLLRRRTTR